MTQCLVNICVVVYNVVVFSGEDIGGQMREMAIFGVPCWGLMVSGGVQGSNDRAHSYRGPTALVRACHPQHRQNLRSPQSCPLRQLELEDLFLVHLAVSGFEVQLLWKCFWCTKSEFGVEFVRSTPPVWYYLELLWNNETSDRSNLSEVEEQLKCHRWSHSCQLTWKQLGAKSLLFLQIFKDSGKMLLFSGGL